MFLRTPDTVTREDFPMLLAQMQDGIDGEMFSGEYRQACRQVIDAIGQADDDDTATHAVLEAALREWVRIGNLEIALQLGEAASC